jgi:hypothetical protein
MFVPPEPSPAFDTTAWTLLAQLHCGDAAAREAAERAIVNRYWPAVYAAVRAMGSSADQAAETTQAFFADVVIGRRLLEAADQSRGRLRSLLRTALKRYRIDMARREAVRDGGRLVPLEKFEREEQQLTRVIQGADPDSAFDRRWAAAVLEEALVRTERHFRQTGRERHWLIFEARVVIPALRSCDPPLLGQIAPELGFRGVPEAAAAVQVVRKRAMALLREVVAETVEGDQEAELEYVLRLLG